MVLGNCGVSCGCVCTELHGVAFGGRSNAMNLLLADRQKPLGGVDTIEGSGCNCVHYLCVGDRIIQYCIRLSVLIKRYY